MIIRFAFYNDPHDLNGENGCQRCQREKNHAISDNCDNTSEEK